MGRQLGYYSYSDEALRKEKRKQSYELFFSNSLNKCTALGKRSPMKHLRLWHIAQKKNCEGIVKILLIWTLFFILIVRPRLLVLLHIMLLLTGICSKKKENGYGYDVSQSNQQFVGLLHSKQHTNKQKRKRSAAVSH